jgi:predicted lipoprotein with Yx(FWY)xxD motif
MLQCNIRAACALAHRRAPRCRMNTLACTRVPSCAHARRASRHSSASEAMAGAGWCRATVRNAPRASLRHQNRAHTAYTFEANRHTQSACTGSRGKFFDSGKRRESTRPASTTSALTPNATSLQWWAWRLQSTTRAQPRRPLEMTLGSSCATFRFGLKGDVSHEHGKFKRRDRLRRATTPDSGTSGSLCPRR